MEKPGENYIEIIKSLWRWYQSSILEPNDYCLMMRLIAISNDDMGWEDCFLRNNYELIGSTKLSYKQLQNARNKLQQLGLISFDQRNGMANCRYQIHFKALLNLSKKGKGDGKVTARFGKGEGVVKINLNQTETELNFSGGPPGMKKPDIVETTQHWKKLVDTWFEFYKKKFEINPSFNGAAAKNLKYIVDRLEKMSTDQQYEWSGEYSVRCLNHFLSKAHNDEWLRSNFLLTNLSTKFDVIVNPKNDGTKSAKHGNSTVSTESAFSKIDSMLAKNGN